MTPTGSLVLAMMGGKAIDKSAFARAWGAGDSGQIGLARLRKQQAQQFFGFGCVIFDGSDGAGNGADVPGADLGRPLLHGGTHSVRVSWRTKQSARRHASIISCQATAGQ